MLIQKNSQVSISFCCTRIALQMIVHNKYLFEMLSNVNRTKQIGHWLQCIAWRLRFLLSKTMGPKTSGSFPANFRYDPG